MLRLTQEELDQLLAKTGSQPAPRTRANRYPWPEAKKRQRRGKEFEDLIEAQNQVYLQTGIAVVTRVATHALLTVKGDRQVLVRKRSTVDFTGAWRGRSIAFDVKENHDPARWDVLKNLHKHQLEFLVNHQNVGGGLSYVLLNQIAVGRIHLIPVDELAWRWHTAKWGKGRRSIPSSEIANYPVVAGADYLATLHRLVRTGTFSSFDSLEGQAPRVASVGRDRACGTCLL